MFLTLLLLIKDASQISCSITTLLCKNKKGSQQGFLHSTMRVRLKGNYYDCEWKTYHLLSTRDERYDDCRSLRGLWYQSYESVRTWHTMLFYGPGCYATYKAQAWKYAKLITKHNQQEGLNCAESQIMHLGRHKCNSMWPETVLEYQMPYNTSHGKNAGKTSLNTFTRTLITSLIIKIQAWSE